MLNNEVLGKNRPAAEVNSSPFQKQIQFQTSIEDELKAAQDKQKELIANLRRKIQAAMDEIASLRAKASANTNIPLYEILLEHRPRASRPRSKFEYPILEECLDRVSRDWNNFRCLDDDSDLTTKIAALRTALSARQALQNEIRHRISKANEILNVHFGHLSTHPEATISGLQTHVKIHQKFVRWLKKFVIDGIHDIQNFEKTFIFAEGCRMRYYYEGKMPLNDGGDGVAGEEVEGIFIPLDVHKRAEAMWLEAEQMKAFENSVSTKHAEKCTSTSDLTVVRHKETFTFAISNNPEANTSTSDSQSMSTDTTDLTKDERLNENVKTWKSTSTSITDLKFMPKGDGDETFASDTSAFISVCPKNPQTVATSFSCQDFKNSFACVDTPAPQRSRCALTCAARFPKQDLALPPPPLPQSFGQLDQVQKCVSANRLLEELFRRPGAANEQVSCEVFNSDTYASRNSSIESINKRVNSVRQLVKAYSQESMEIVQNIERIKSRDCSKINTFDLAQVQNESECEESSFEPEPESVETAIASLRNMAKEIVSNSSSADSICFNQVREYENKVQFGSNSSTFSFTQADRPNSDSNNNNTFLASEVNELIEKLKKASDNDEVVSAVDKEQMQTSDTVKRSRIPQPFPRRSKLMQATCNLSAIEEEPEEVRRADNATRTRREKRKSIIPRLRSKSQSVSRVPASEKVVGSDSARSSSSPSSRRRDYSSSPQASSRIQIRVQRNQVRKNFEVPLPLKSKYDTKRVPVCPRCAPAYPAPNAEAARILPPPPPVPPRARARQSYTTEYKSS